MDLAPYQPYLGWIAGQQPAMVSLVQRWAAINSGSYHLKGLAEMRLALERAFGVLGGVAEVLPLAPITQIDARGDKIQLPMAPALSIVKRPQAPVQVLLVAHMDTVYGVDHPFQAARLLSDNVMNGPGVADLKGGIVVMLHALQALEQSPWAEQIGWQVLFNPDEEIGSVASDPLLRRAAQGKHIGLVYEPALADGTLAGARKGSGNFTLVVRGRSAHAGRNPEEGRNAIVLAAELTTAIFALNGQREGVTINPGKIEGGGALNVVPDLAVLRFNVRTAVAEDEVWLQEAVAGLLASARAREGYEVEMHGHFTRRPKPVAPAIQALFTLVQACGEALGLGLGVKPSGGCCDGNNLWYHGLANIDTLGVRGANIHSAQEVIYLDSLTERAQLSALLLMRLAAEGPGILGGTA